MATFTTGDEVGPHYTDDGDGRPATGRGRENRRAGFLGAAIPELRR